MATALRACLLRRLLQGGVGCAMTYASVAHGQRVVFRVFPFSVVFAVPVRDVLVTLVMHAVNNTHDYAYWQIGDE